MLDSGRSYSKDTWIFRLIFPNREVALMAALSLSFGNVVVVIGADEFITCDFRVQFGLLDLH